MAISILFEERVEIPLGLGDLADFRRWAASNEFPEHGRIDYLAGRIEVDMSPEDLHTHGKLKTEIIVVLGRLIKQNDLGELYTDSTRVSCPSGDWSVEPDIVFVSNEAINGAQVRLVPKVSGAADRYAEMEGAPDLIVEIVSDSSVHKDTRRLPAAYFQAGVRELWLVDARGETIRFEVLCRGSTQYEPAAVDADGFQRSAVLDRCYRLERTRNRHGRLAFELLER